MPQHRVDPPPVETTGPTTKELTEASELGPAMYVDPRLGTRQETAFIGDGPMRLLGSTHTPRDEAIGGVIVCSPIGEESLRNHRREVLLGRALAAAGIAVQRFQYRGSGSSDGEAEHLTIDTMLEDTLTAIEVFTRRLGSGPLAFLGTRLGAFVASAAATRFPGSPLALWEPAVDGGRYMQEVFRARSVRDLQENADELDSSGELAELRSGGVVDVLGYPISAALYESIVGRRLVVELGQEHRPVLLAQISPRQRFRPEYARLSQEWREQGWDVETLTFVHPREAWWFAAPDDTVQPGSRMRAQRALLDATSDWIVRQFQGTAP